MMKGLLHCQNATTGCTRLGIMTKTWPSAKKTRQNCQPSSFLSRPPRTQHMQHVILVSTLLWSLHLAVMMMWNDSRMNVSNAEVKNMPLFLLNANRKSSLSAMTSPFEDGGEMMMENSNTRIPIPPSVPIRAPSTGSSDRKPLALPDGVAQSNSHYDAYANVPRHILPGSFPMSDSIPLGGNFGTMHDVGMNQPQNNSKRG